MFRSITPEMENDTTVEYQLSNGPLLEWTLRMLTDKLVVVDVDGTLTDGNVIYGSNGDRYRQFSVIDGYGFEMLMKSGFDVLILSGENDDCIKHRARKLKADYALAVKDKVSYVKKWYGRYKELYVIGDDVNDLGLMRMEETVLSATPKDSIISRMNLEDVTELTKKGGDGAFREFAEMVLSSNGTSLYTEFHL